jgi:transposase
MLHRDFRSLDENTQAELRRLALLSIDRGRDLNFVAELVDVHIQTIRDWMRKRKTLEKKNFKGERRGRSEGDKRILEKEDELDIKNLIENKTPDTIGLGAALWTRRVVHRLIKEKTNNDLHLNTVGDYLIRWGFTPQRPGKVANEQDEKKIKKWIEEEYPRILEQAEQEDAEICFSDETGVSLNTYYGRTYAKKGITPHIKLPAKKNHISTISSMSNMGLLKFMIYKGGLDNDLFTEFLERITRDSKRKIFLILDNLQVHKSKMVLKWVSKNENKIALFFPTSLRSTIQSCGVIKQYLKTKHPQKLLSKEL